MGTDAGTFFGGAGRGDRHLMSMFSIKQQASPPADSEEEGVVQGQKKGEICPVKNKAGRPTGKI